MTRLISYTAIYPDGSLTRSQIGFTEPIDLTSTHPMSLDAGAVPIIADVNQKVPVTLTISNIGTEDLSCFLSISQGGVITPPVVIPPGHLSSMDVQLDPPVWPARSHWVYTTALALNPDHPDKALSCRLPIAFDLKGSGVGIIKGGVGLPQLALAVGIAAISLVSLKNRSEWK